MTNPFNPDLSQQGTKAGAEDAAAGKPKSTLGVAAEPKAWVFGGSSIDSYSKSYHQAYDNESAKRQGVYQTQPSAPPFSQSNAQTGVANTLNITGNAIHAVIKPDPVEAFLLALMQFKQQIETATLAMSNSTLSCGGYVWNDANYHEFMSRWARVRQQIERIEQQLQMQAKPQLEAYIQAARNVRV